LSGIDVARKILILIRESGYKWKLTKLKMNLYARSILKPLQMKLFESLQEHAEHFESIYKEALSKESIKIRGAI
jgi:aspartokinase/homoserine dehydrogenase 1